MLLTEYDEVAAMELFRKDGREEGREEGNLETLVSLVKEALLSIDIAAKKANMTADEFRIAMGKA